MREQPDSFDATFAAAASAALAGRPAEAEKPWRSLRQLMPELRISNLKDLFPFRRSEDFDRVGRGPEKSGLAGVTARRFGIW